VCGSIASVSKTLYNGDMKTLKSNLVVLAAQKAQRDRQRVSLIRIAKETGISKYTIYALANDEISEYPKSVLESLCAYFGCEIGDLLKLEETHS
jgi:DNA-binding Xre family transcriptional regulator